MTEVGTSPLRRLTAALGSAISSDDVATAILQHGLHELGALTVSLWLIDDVNETLEYSGGAGAVSSGVERFASISLQALLPGPVVVKTGEPVVYRSSSERNRRFPDLASFPTSSESSAVLPLQSRAQVIGCLTVSFAEERDISDAELEQLQTVADQCALALDRARLLDRERRARETVEFLGEATRLMVTTLDPDDVLDQLLNHAVPLVADWCAVFVYEDGALHGTALRIAGAPDVARKIREEATRVDVDADLPVSRAFRTGRYEHIAEPSDDLLRDMFGDAAPSVRALGWRDVVVCPIITRGDRVGVISFAFTTSERLYTPDVFAVATGLAGRAGMALDVAQRFERERATAATLVAAMLPQRLPVVDGWSISATYLPADHAVCGDWYDVAPLPDGNLLVGVGDAAGHGLPAAALMAELRNAGRGLGFAGHQPDRLLDDLSALACQAGRDNFATAAYGRLNPSSGTGSWALAGHPPPLLVDGSGKARFLELPSRPPLGTAGVGRAECIEIAPGDTLLLYTDGLIERRGESLDHGLARLASAAEGPATNAAERAKRVVDVLCNDLSDDCCLLLLERVHAAT